jgi:hypothetical protein
LSETLSDNLGQKLYTYYRAKRMVILRGKRKKLTTPLSILGQNVGEKIKYIYPAKKIPIPGAKHLNLTTPTQSL